MTVSLNIGPYCSNSFFWVQTCWMDFAFMMCWITEPNHGNPRGPGILLNARTFFGSWACEPFHALRNSVNNQAATKRTTEMHATANASSIGYVQCTCVALSCAMHIKIQLVVYYQCCVLIGWATTRLYVIAAPVAKSAGFLILAVKKIKV